MFFSDVKLRYCSFYECLFILRFRFPSFLPRREAHHLGTQKHLVSAVFVALRCVRGQYTPTGPTNSGKTYQAIERLKKAGANQQPGDGPAGLFCGPLRLLALEVYEQVMLHILY